MITTTIKRRVRRVRYVVRGTLITAYLVVQILGIPFRKVPTDGHPPSA